MPPRLHELHVKNFRSLRDVTIELGGLNVLVGANGAGKSNVLDVLLFLGNVASADLTSVMNRRWPDLVFSAAPLETDVNIRLEGRWAAPSGSSTNDSYSLRIVRAEDDWWRIETFNFGTETRPFAALLDAQQLEVIAPDTPILEPDGLPAPEDRVQLRIDPNTSGLALLPRLAPEYGSKQASELGSLLANLRFIDSNMEYLDVSGGRNRYTPGASVQLSGNAENLAAFLLKLREDHPASFSDLESDAVAVLPQLEAIDFELPSGAAKEVIVVLRERGLSDPTELADASLGTKRLLALLAALYDPTPPALTCIEEVEFGLHPQALELIVDRLRDASERTQFLVATHSPTFVDCLRPEEIIVCERRDDGSSAIPAISTEQIQEIVTASENEPLGRLWFSGALGGNV